MRTKFHAALAAAAVTAALVLPAQAQDKLRIGYSISKTGPYAGGASITTRPSRAGRACAMSERMTMLPRLCPTKCTRGAFSCSIAPSTARPRRVPICAMLGP